MGSWNLLFFASSIVNVKFNDTIILLHSPYKDCSLRRKPVLGGCLFVCLLFSLPFELLREKKNPVIYSRSGLRNSKRAQGWSSSEWPVPRARSLSNTFNKKIFQTIDFTISFAADVFVIASSLFGNKETKTKGKTYFSNWVIKKHQRIITARVRSKSEWPSHESHRTAHNELKRPGHCFALFFSKACENHV